VGASPFDPERVARALYARDPSVTTFGIELVAASLDRAEVRMAVRPEFCNGFAILHGGITFLLADSAMAFASNAENVVSLASSAAIDWLAPVASGAVLTAVAELRWTNGRTTMWDITVTSSGETVALMRGTTRKTGTAIVEV
jgi:acyl-CoA thioesterase